MIQRLIARFLTLFPQVRQLQFTVDAQQKRLERQTIRITERDAEVAVLRQDQHEARESRISVAEWTKRALQAEALAGRLEDTRKWHVKTERSLREKLKSAEAKSEIDAEALAEVKELKRLLHNEGVMVRHWKARHDSIAENMARWSSQLETTAREEVTH